MRYPSKRFKIENAVTAREIQLFKTRHAGKGLQTRDLLAASEPEMCQLLEGLDNAQVLERKP